VSAPNSETEQNSISLDGTPKRVYLIGFMGCGKSTIGPILANVFGYSFIDLDAEIVSHAGMSIPSVFREYGEAAFRAMERSCLRRISSDESVVISLGGGVLTHPDNARHILQTGLVIYLKMDVDTAVSRLQRKRGRPMLWGSEEQPLEGDELAGRISDLMEQRERDYGQAHLTIPTTNRHVGGMVDRVASAIRTWTIYH
jgi:shikimate kinase